MHPSPRPTAADEGGGIAQIAAAMSRLADGQDALVQRVEAIEMAAAGDAATRDAFLSGKSSGGVRAASGGGGQGARRNAGVREVASGPIYARHTAENSRYVRPIHAPVFPGQWDLHGNKTYDTLAASKGSTLVHEFKALYPAVSYSFDAIFELESVVESLDADDDSPMAESIVRAYNTFSGALKMMQSRLGVLQSSAVSMGSANPIDKAVGELARERARGYGDDAILYDPAMANQIDELRELATKARLKSLATAAGGAPLAPKPTPRPAAVTPKPQPNQNVGPPKPKDK